MSGDLLRPRRALLSVADKRGLVEFARALAAHGIELVASGGTAGTLRQAGLAVTEVSELTGFPEILDGRVKTLHPRIHGALLARAGRDEETLAVLGIAPIDLVAVALYPFEATIARSGVSASEAIEQIDVGGPALLRAAAKNSERVAALCDPTQYPELLAWLAQQGGTRLEQRRRLAAEAFRRTAAYDAAIAAWLGNGAAGGDGPWPERLAIGLTRAATLRYGENPHQQAALYREPGLAGGLAAVERLAGIELSYNNLLDAEAAWSALAPFAEPACAIVKHASPCGIAVGSDPATAYEGAYACDPLSAFGGVIAFNRALEAETIERVLARQFVELILAPGFSEAALAALARKPRVRALAVPEAGDPGHELRRLGGLWLAQQPDTAAEDPAAWQVVTRRAPDADELADLRFAWHCVRPVRSNAVVLARSGRTLGIGGGQPSRVWSVRLAVLKAREAGLELAGAVMASDGFLPFPDGLEEAARAGIRAVIQPGGSLRDPEVIAAADALGVAMVFTGRRHFRH